jgi:YD repeat-containing protein
MRVRAFCCLFLISFFLVKVNGQFINATNGNFFINYSDVEFQSDSLPFNISRSYNSTSVAKGWFGTGWGGPYETYLHTIPGGGVVVFYWGGTVEIFRPAEWDRSEIAAAVERLAEIAFKNGEVQTPEDIVKLKERYTENEVTRVKQWVKAIRSGAVSEYDLPAGLKLSSTRTESSFVEVLSDGFRLPQQGGAFWQFDKTGRMEKITDKKGNQISFSYSGTRRNPFEISDNAGNKVSLVFNSDNLVTTIIATQSSGKKDSAVYTYDPSRKDLLTSKDIGGFYYQYGWDTKHNLTSITYVDGRKTLVTYDENSYATSLTKKNGERIEYDYPQVSKDEYGTRTRWYDSTGKWSRSSSTWFVMKTNDVGKRWQYKRIIVENQDSTTYINNEKLAQADTVYLNGGKYFTYEYDNKGILKSISSNEGLLVTVEVANNRLKKLTSRNYSYEVLYEKDKVKTLIAAPGKEISFPLAKPYQDGDVLKSDAMRFVPAFLATSYWYDLHISNAFLAEARKLKF